MIHLHTHIGIVASIMYQYFLKIVPAEINYLSGKSIHTYQYSVSRQERDLQMQANNGLPGKRSIAYNFGHGDLTRWML